MNKGNILSYKNNTPLIDQSAKIFEGSIIVGDVKVGKNTSIWYNSVVRGDTSYVEIGEGTNIQDLTLIHTSRNLDGQTLIGNYVTIGHSAVIHACKINNYSLIGMSATILDGSVIEPYSQIAAGALVAPNTTIPSGELWAGVPAKFKRKLTKEEISFIKESALNYIKLSNEYSSK